MRRSRTTLILAALAVLLAAAPGCAYKDLIKKRLPPPQRVTGGILFQYEAPAATVVTLAGNWPGNDWGGTSSPAARYDNTIGRMTDPDDDGIWTIVVDLAPGRYQYKFVVDNNTWVTDPSNPDTATEGGFTNSLLVVK
jgi:1,4-alpha-glucan branching enzyme